MAQASQLEWNLSYAPLRTRRYTSLVCKSPALDYMDIPGVKDIMFYLLRHLLNGVGGVQLWVSSHWHTSQGDLMIDPGHLHILSASTQRMVVRLCKDDLRLILVVAHAPNCPSFEEATNFWSSLTTNIPSAYRSWNLIAMVDANARVG